MTNQTYSILGRSASGKGTQIELLMKWLSQQQIVFERIYLGSQFRALEKEDTLLGQRVREILGEGGLPPSAIASYLQQRSIYESDILRENPEALILFDGSPRRIEEAQLLDRILWDVLGRPHAQCIYIDVPEDECARRMRTRGREDDRDDAIRSRLEYFRSAVIPVVSYYEQRGQLLRVSGMGTEEEVHQRIIDALQ